MRFLACHGAEVAPYMSLGNLFSDVTGHRMHPPVAKVIPAAVVRDR